MLKGVLVLCIVIVKILVIVSLMLVVIDVESDQLNIFKLYNIKLKYNII